MDLELPTFSGADTKKVVISKRQAPPTVCQVCQGKATGHHYDVASCNGCKSFFRRVTTEKLSYTCKFIDKCFDKLQPGDTLPKCRSCRFNKCVEAGMNPLGIQSELKQEMKMTKLPIDVEKPRKTIDSQVGELIEKVLRIDAKSEQFRDSAYNPHQFPSLKEYIKKETSILSIADAYGPIKGWPLEEKIIEEHCKLMQTQKTNHPLMKRWIIFELVIQIEIAKALPYFADLSESDRYFLIQDTTLMSTHLTKAFYSFEHKSDRLLRPDGVRYYERGYPGIQEFRKLFQEDIGMRCLRPLLRVGLDRVEFVLLRVLVLMSPGASEISEDARKYLTKVRQKYNIALFRYTMAKHGASGPSRFADILGFIDVLEHQQRDHRDLALLMKMKKKDRQAVPILDEIMKN